RAVRSHGQRPRDGRDARASGEGVPRPREAGGLAGEGTRLRGDAAGEEAQGESDGREEARGEEAGSQERALSRYHSLMDDEPFEPFEATVRRSHVMEPGSVVLVIDKYKGDIEVGYYVEVVQGGKKKARAKVATV